MQITSKNCQFNRKLDGLSNDTDYPTMKQPGSVKKTSSMCRTRSVTLIFQIATQWPAWYVLGWSNNMFALHVVVRIQL
ncbi:uncharacterized protein PHALS_02077 [Plasmopara halstedii]|uniref:Uncharacterized protein n=1 Tax=Plasmopara halstedii TaxID=4781 RepID=A0A0P1AUH5_PLAHL|nr:uncharacterized protein PHALS_02077 [Plasmopara halstedii]CEG45805.1 hypothetical protein PHALS_02077 [Plasmopara halstedii]|eukprot:XP_024582174.1 hypothetical protein PHALS_02077 [Plasmopara halstedii]